MYLYDYFELIWIYITHEPVLPLYLKAELEQCKEAQLEEQRRSFSTEHEQKERGYTEKMSQLTAQLQQLDDVVAQVLNAQAHKSVNSSH
jgi:hypothetical protein